MIRKLILALALIPSISFADMHSFCAEFEKMAFNIRTDYLKGVNTRQLLSHYSQGASYRSFQYLSAQNLVNSSIQVPLQITPKSFALSARKACPEIWGVYRTM